MEEQKKRGYGPALPQKRNSDDEESKEEKKVYGPTMPSSVEVPKKQYGPTMPSSVEVPKKQYGPTMPGSGKERPLGPERLAPVSAAEKPVRNRSRSPPGRDSWMTEVGKQGQIKMDPLNIKARTFLQKGPTTEAVEKDSAVIEEELAIEEQVKEYNAAYRSRTLQEAYEEELKDGKVKAVEKEREERIFDWERDMNASVRRMSGKSAKELMNRSNLQDRFGSSTSSKRFL